MATRCAKVSLFTPFACAAFDASHSRLDRTRIGRRRADDAGDRPLFARAFVDEPAVGVGPPLVGRPDHVLGDAGRIGQGADVSLRRRAADALDQRGGRRGTCRSTFDEVRQHLPSAVRLGLAVATPDSIAGRALAIAARRNAMGHARRFIAGTNADEVLAAAGASASCAARFTLDLLGEAVTSEREADRYLQAYLDLIAGIAPTVNSLARGAADRSRRRGRAAARERLDQALGARQPVRPDRPARARPRAWRSGCGTLLRVAGEQRAFVNVDMESYQHQGPDAGDLQAGADAKTSFATAPTWAS